MKYAKLYLVLAAMSTIVACSDDDKFETEQERTIHLKIEEQYIQENTSVGLFVQEGTEDQPFKAHTYKVTLEGGTLYTSPTNKSEAAFLPKDGSPVNIFAFAPYNTRGVTTLQNSSVFLDLSYQKDWIDSPFQTALLTNIAAPIETEIKAIFKNQLAYLELKIIKGKEENPVDLTKKSIKVIYASTSGLFSMTENKFTRTNMLPNEWLRTFDDPYLAEGVFIPTGRSIEIEFFDTDGTLINVSRLLNDSIRLSPGTKTSIIIYLDSKNAKASYMDTFSEKE